jgi:hypothetical protein
MLKNIWFKFKKVPAISGLTMLIFAYFQILGLSFLTGSLVGSPKMFAGFAVKVRKNGHFCQGTVAFHIL